MDPYGLNAILLTAIAAIFTLLAWRGARVGTGVQTAVVHIYRYSRRQRAVTFCVLVPLTTFVALLPYTFMPFTGMSDVFISFLLLTGCGLLFVEAKNRHIVTSTEGITSGSWRHSKSLLSWASVRRVTFHDTFGGYFLVQHSSGRLYIPIQVERPLDLIRDLESNVPPAALASAKKGIQICRAHLS